MFIRLFLLSTVLASPCCDALAVSGTPGEQDACRPDVRRFCGNLAKDAEDTVYLTCLENHRDNLSAGCLAVLVDHGR